MIGRVVAAYAGWLVGIGLAAWLVTSLHALAMGVYVLARGSVWGVAFFQNVVFLVLVIAWLSWVVGSEHWLRTAAGRGQLGRAMVWALGPLCLAAIASFAVVRMV